MACIRYLRLRVLRMLTRVVEAPEQLGGEHVGVAGPPEGGDGLAHDPLGLARRVGLGVVEEVDPGAVGRGQAVLGQAAGQLGTEGHPRAERQHADLQSGMAQTSVLHLHGRSFSIRFGRILRCRSC